MELTERNPSGYVSQRCARIISRPPLGLYGFWKDLEKLPTIIDHLASVRKLDETHSHWVVRVLGGKRFEWTAELVEDKPGKVLSWKSIESSALIKSVTVEFRKAPGDRGTIVELSLLYNPPGGSAGATILKLFGEGPETEIRKGLNRFKQLMETGEILTTEGQPSGRERLPETSQAA